MASISIGSGNRAKLNESFIDEVRELATSYWVNELWHGLTFRPLDPVTQNKFREVVNEQDVENKDALDRLNELFDQYLEFVEESTGAKPELWPL